MDVMHDDLAVINSLNFESIKVKLMHKRTGEGWTKEQADAVEQEYRRFLYLVKKYPGEVTAPSMEVDMFWHQHILDTVQYARDCDAVFGYFLHHNPYFGMRLAADDSAVWQRAGERMRELYEETFGDSYQGDASAFCSRDAAPRSHVFRAKGSALNYCTTDQPLATKRTNARVGVAFCSAPTNVAFCSTPTNIAFSAPPSVDATFASPQADPLNRTPHIATSPHARLLN